MAEKVIVEAATIVKPFGNFSQAVKVGAHIYIAAQLPLDPTTGRPVGGEMDSQAEQVVQNVAAILEACGGGLGNLVKATLHLTDLREFPAWDKVSRRHMAFQPPAITTIGVTSLPGGCKLSLEGVAVLSKSEMGGTGMI